MCDGMVLEAIMLWKSATHSIKPKLTEGYMTLVNYDFVFCVCVRVTEGIQKEQ